MRPRLIAILVVLALVLGGAILLANAGGGNGGTTEPPSTTIAAATVATTTTTPTSTTAPTTTATTAPPTTAVTTTEPGPPLPVGCFLIDDARGVLVVLEDSGAEREIGPIVDSSTGDPPQGGDPTQPSQLEALAHDPVTGGYYATSWGLLGTLDVRTARFTEVGDTGLADVDGLAFDADGALYGVSRVTRGPDRLVKVDTATGRAEEIGPVAGAGVLEDVDDLAFDLRSGTLYGVTNHEGEVERTSVLVTIDPAVGAAVVVGTGLGIVDGEGLTFADGGRLWVTTGERGGSALFLVELDAGTAEGVALLGAGLGDYEAIACPNGDT